MPQLHPGRVWPFHFRRDLSFPGFVLNRPPEQLKWTFSLTNTGTIGSHASSLSTDASFPGNDGSPDMTIEWDWHSVTIGGHTAFRTVTLFVDPSDKQLHLRVEVFVPGQVDVTWELKPPTTFNYVSMPIHANFTTSNASRWGRTTTSTAELFLLGKVW